MTRLPEHIDRKRHHQQPERPTRPPRSDHMNEQDREALARTIWETSRADESTISYLGANIIADALVPVVEQIAERRAAEVVSGVRAWCAINEIAEPPLDWVGLGEFLDRAALGGEDRG